MGSGGALVSQGFGRTRWNMQKWEEQPLLVQAQRVGRYFWYIPEKTLDTEGTYIAE